MLGYTFLHLLAQCFVRRRKNGISATEHDFRTQTSRLPDQSSQAVFDHNLATRRESRLGSADSIDDRTQSPSSRADTRGHSPVASAHNRLQAISLRSVGSQTTLCGTKTAPSSAHNSDSTDADSTCRKTTERLGRGYSPYSGRLFAVDAPAQRIMALEHHLYHVTPGFGWEATEKVVSLPDTPAILVLGAGECHLPNEIGRRFPRAKVVAMEIFDFGARLEPNVNLYMDDPNKDLPWRDEYFNHIHLRGLGTCINDWPALFQQAFLHLQHGGYCVFEDMNILLPSSNDIQAECRKIVDAAEGRTSRKFCSPLDDYRQWMEGAHFDICMKKRTLVDLGQPNTQIGWLRWLVKEKILDMATSYFETRGEHMAFARRMHGLEFRDMGVEFIKVIGRKPVASRVS